MFYYLPCGNSQSYACMLIKRVKVCRMFGNRWIFVFHFPRNRLNQLNCTSLRVRYVEDSIGHRIKENHSSYRYLREKLLNQRPGCYLF